MFPIFCYFLCFWTVDKRQAMMVTWIIRSILCLFSSTHCVTFVHYPLFYVLSSKFCNSTIFHRQRKKLIWYSTFVSDRDGIFVLYNQKLFHFILFLFSFFILCISSILMQYVCKRVSVKEEWIWNNFALSQLNCIELIHC